MSATDCPQSMPPLYHCRYRAIIPCLTDYHTFALTHVLLKSDWFHQMTEWHQLFLQQSLVIPDDVFIVRDALHKGVREWIDVKYLVKIPIRISCRQFGHRIVATTMMRRADRYMMLSPTLILVELRIADLGDRFCAGNCQHRLR